MVKLGVFHTPSPYVILESTKRGSRVEAIGPKRSRATLAADSESDFLETGEEILVNWSSSISVRDTDNKFVFKATK